MPCKEILSIKLLQFLKFIFLKKIRNYNSLYGSMRWRRFKQVENFNGVVTTRHQMVQSTFGSIQIKVNKFLKL